MKSILLLLAMATAVLAAPPINVKYNPATGQIVEPAPSGLDAGSTDTYAVTLSPPITAYVTGGRYTFRANTINTGAATVNFNGLGAKQIVRVAPGTYTALFDGDILAGQWVDLVYDGTFMQMQSLAATFAASAYVPIAQHTGGGVLATGGFNLTVPATGTAALLGTANVFTQLVTAPSFNGITLRKDAALDNYFLAGAGNGTASSFYNVSIGGESMNALTSGYADTAVGFRALQTVTTGQGNTAVGKGALSAVTTSSNNTAVGFEAAIANTSGDFNTVVGSSAFHANTTGAQSTAIGYNALNANTTGTQNTAIGYNALAANLTGGNNVAVGGAALSHNTSGVYNTGVGIEALTNNTTGTANTAIGGYDVMYSNTTGSANAVLGYGALFANTTGGGNTVVGYQAARTGNGIQNIFLGQYAGYYETGSNTLLIDNLQRTTEADTRTKAIIYGVMASTVAGQTLALNAGAITAGGTVNAVTGFGVGATATATAPFRFDISVNDSENTLFKNANSGAAAAAGVVMESNAGQGVIRAHSIAHSVWPGTWLFAAPASGTGVVFYNGGATQPFDFYTNGTKRLTIADAGVAIGTGGTPILKVLSAAATLDFGSTVAGAVTDLTITVTGAAVGNVVALGIPNGSVPASGSFTAWVSATNTVTVRYENNDLLTARDPASGSFRAMVTQF